MQVVALTLRFTVSQAPEIIRDQAYDARCDWWSLGVVIYEVEYTTHTPAKRQNLTTRPQILFAHPPFDGENREESRLKVLVSQFFYLSTPASLTFSKH